jgi:hypothetical protein
VNVLNKLFTSSRMVSGDSASASEPEKNAENRSPIRYLPVKRCMGIDYSHPAKQVLLRLRAFNDGYNQSFANETLPSEEEIEQIPENMSMWDYVSLRESEGHELLL